MFCRISADRAQGGDIKYYPFRLTPYQLTIRDFDDAEPQPCCLLIAERVHSGYEGICRFKYIFIYVSGGKQNNIMRVQL